MSITSLVPKVIKRASLYQKLRNWYYRPRRSRQLSEREAYEMVSRIGADSSNAWIRKSSSIGGWIFQDEHQFLYDLASLPLEGDVLEIGSWQGKSTCLLAGACIDNGSASKIICVDSFLMDGNPFQVTYHRKLIESGGTFNQFVENAKRFGYYDRLVILGGLSQEVIPYVNAKIKMAFVDGAHDRESVARDINLVKPFIVIGGVIALHDSDENWPGVKRAIEDTLLVDQRFAFHRKVNSVECWKKIQ